MGTLTVRYPNGRIVELGDLIPCPECDGAGHLERQEGLERKESYRCPTCKGMGRIGNLPPARPQRCRCCAMGAFCDWKEPECDKWRPKGPRRVLPPGHPMRAPFDQKH